MIKVGVPRQLPNPYVLGKDLKNIRKHPTKYWLDSENPNVAPEHVQKDGGVHHVKVWLHRRMNVRDVEGAALFQPNKVTWHKRFNWRNANIINLAPVVSGQSTPISSRPRCLDKWVGGHFGVVCCGNNG